MNTKRVSFDDIQRAIRHLEARGQKPSISRVQRDIGYDYCGVSELMHAHRLTQTAMNRMVSVSRSGSRQRDNKDARHQKLRAEPRATRGRPLERVQGPEPIEPYKALAAALLEQAIRDVRSSSLHDRRRAWHWLRANPDCADFCEWLSFDHGRLIETLEARAEPGRLEAVSQMDATNDAIRTRRHRESGRPCLSSPLID